MKIFDMEQGTDEWFEARKGLATASRFRDVFTSTGKASASQDKYINELIAEMMSRKPLENFTSEWMRRGTELEPEARTYYELETDVEVQEVGFAVMDLDEVAVDATGRIGGSPDGIFEGGGLEIKCPSPAKHVEYLRKGKCPPEYFPQVQGLMLIFDVQQWDFMSYHPDMDKQLIITVPRDNGWTEGFMNAAIKFNNKMQKALEQIA